MKPKLKDADRKLKENGSREGLFRTVRVGKQKYEGLRISCADTECVFEFKAYKFNAEGYDSGKRRHRAPRKAAPIVVAHPVPSAVPQLQSQSSTDGEEATVWSGGCPQPLHIPSSTHRGHSAQREDEEDQEEEGVASPHDSNKYGGPTTVETNL